MDYRVQRLKEDLTNASRRNKQQKKANASLKNAHEKLKKQNEFLIKRENKLQQIEQMFKDKKVDIEKLEKMVLENE